MILLISSELLPLLGKKKFIDCFIVGIFFPIDVFFKKRNGSAFNRAIQRTMKLKVEVLGVGFS